MKILGISAFYHDSAACIVVDGLIIAAAQEERFTRIKHDPAFPHNSINFCLSYSGFIPNDIDYVVFYDKPLRKFSRLISTYLTFAPHGFESFSEAIPLWITDRIFQKKQILRGLKSCGFEGNLSSKKLLFSEHHLSHAASAYYPSPFQEAAILTMDGVGEWATTSVGIGNGSELSIQKEIHFPHSIGLLYSAFTYFAGFKVNSGEYKLMGLAPYGKPIYASLIKNKLIDIKEDGTFALDMAYFNYCTGLTMTNEKFHSAFGGMPRKPESSLTQYHMDLAASIQSVTEEIVLKLAKNIRQTTGMINLCLAGGVALNCVSNGKLVKENLFDNIWVQPAAGDAGGCIGAALALYHLVLKQPRIKGSELDGMRGSYLGPEFSDAEIAHELLKYGANFTVHADDEIVDKAARALADGKAVGWMNGRMEFGPRSLGARSILADPRSPVMQKLLNLKVKYRESFRPFAPSILHEDLSEWFDLSEVSPYMLMVADIKEAKRIGMSDSEKLLFGIDKLNVLRSTIPAVTHVDYSARIQTVHKETNSKYHRLITRFKELTGCPVLVNTSFNVRGEPIVCSPGDAFRCFMGTELDLLVVGNALLIKDQQSVKYDKYLHKFNLD